MGLSDAEADAYAKDVIRADFEEAGDEDVIRKVLGDLTAAGVEIDDAQDPRGDRPQGSRGAAPDHGADQPVMAMAADEIERLIRDAIPDAQVTITDLAGDGDHYAARVVSAAFAGIEPRRASTSGSMPRWARGWAMNCMRCS